MFAKDYFPVTGWDATGFSGNTSSSRLWVRGGWSNAARFFAKREGYRLASGILETFRFDAKHSEATRKSMSSESRADMGSTSPHLREVYAIISQWHRGLPVNQSSRCPASI